MAEIPVPLPHTVTAINRELIARTSQGDGYGIPMSDAINPCDRALWYTLHWASPPKPNTGEGASRMETGLYWEGRLLADLERAGVKITFHQWRAALANGFLRGKIDGIAEGLQEAPKAPHIAECKSLKAEKFRGVIKHGLEKHIPEHYAQCQLYMHARGLERAAYLCINKDTDERHIERIKYDPVYCVKIIGRIEAIAKAEATPPRLHDDPTSKAAFQCGYCQHRAICHEGALARVNCRTCLFGNFQSPELMLCNHDDQENRDLHYKRQQTGCERHRFTPSLHPGEEIDIISGDVIYSVKGERIIDGDKHISTEAFGDERASSVDPIESDDEIPY